LSGGRRSLKLSRLLYRVEPDRLSVSDQVISSEEIFNPEIETLEDLRARVNQRPMEGLDATERWADKSHAGVDETFYPSDQTLKGFAAHAGETPTRGRFMVCFPGSLTREDAARAVEGSTIPIEPSHLASLSDFEAKFTPHGRSSIKFSNVIDQIGPHMQTYLAGQMYGLRSTAVVTYPRREALEREAFADHKIAKLLEKLDQDVGPIALYGPPGQEDKATAIFYRDGIATRRRIDND